MLWEHVSVVQINHRRPQNLNGNDMNDVLAAAFDKAVATLGKEFVAMSLRG